VLDVAVFYIVDSSSIGTLYFYEWNSISNFFELKSTVQASASTVVSDWENNTFLGRTENGVLFKEYGQSTMKYFETETYTYAESSVSISGDTYSTFATTDLVNLILKQTRDDWLNYDATVIPQLAGFVDDSYIYTFTYASTTLTATAQIVVPCSAD